MRASQVTRAEARSFFDEFGRANRPIHALAWLWLGFGFGGYQRFSGGAFGGRPADGTGEMSGAVRLGGRQVEGRRQARSRGQRRMA